MATKDELLALAERCEKATGPDRELDEAIWLAVIPGSRAFNTVVPATEKRKGWTIREHREASGRMIIVPSFTASLDAAMTLVPVGWSRRSTWCPKARYPAVWELRGPATKQTAQVCGYTDAGALCAAALRALAHPPGDA